MSFISMLYKINSVTNITAAVFDRWEGGDEEKEGSVKRHSYGFDHYVS